MLLCISGNVKKDEIKCNSTSINNVGLHFFHFIEAFSCMGVQTVWELQHGNQ